ncbi:MAG: C10 family peptidase [Prevotella sp.]|nr:C10 family peptidase [Prevotella sp.]
MRKILLLMLSLVMVTMVKAEGVTPQQALEQARNFIQKRENNGSRPRRAPGTAASRLVMAKQVNGLYVFKMAKNEGFVIVSNDDRTEPILGYSDSGNFDPDNMPDNMRAWLQGYADQIAWLNEHPEFDNVIAKAPTKNPIAPLMLSKWDQDEPYNNLCPIYSNERCVTGCVATAMAQVMYYHGSRTGQPAATTATITSYTTSTNKLSVEAVAAETTLDWNNMLPVYGTGTTTAQQTAVATLMKVCGAALRMDYDIAQNGGSSAYCSSIPSALKNYFGYSSTTRYVSRGDYSLSGWNSLIYNELLEGRPVCYGGQSSGGGHAFVIDGYDGDELFHVNWGWGGHQDGYFLLSVLNPGSTAGLGASSSNDGYSFTQEAIIGAKPNDGESIELGLTFISPTISGDAIKFAKVKNNTGATNSFDYGIGIVDENGNITPKVFNQNRNLSSSSYYSDQSFTISTSWGDGTYKVIPISRVSGTDKWIPDLNFDYFEVVINGNSITITPVGFTLASAANLSVDGEIKFPGSKKVNIEQPVEATIRNTGGEFYGPLYLFASTSNSKGSYKDRAGITLLTNKTIDVQFNFKPTATGTYNIWITSDSSGSNVIGQSTVVIEAASTGASNLENVQTVVNKNKGTKILGTSVQCVGSIKNNGTETYAGDVMAVLLVPMNDGSGYWTSADYVEIPAIIASGETVDLSYEFSNLTIGQQYWISYFYPSGSQINTNPNVGQFTCVAAVETYLSDGTRSAEEAVNNISIENGVSALNLSGVSGVTNVTGGNENTLFIFGADDNVPSSLNGRNVVKGGNAENITLQDGTDFYSPVTFTAENISYTRTFDTGMTRDYKNWTTIVLPFDVNKVTVDLTGAGYSQYPAYEIDWFHNATETKKNFWVMEFGSEEGGIVNFSHAAEIKAARPLLIAVPGVEWGSANDLTGLPITFHGTNATVSGDFRAATSGDNYKMKGVVAQKTLNDIFVLNADGNAFTRQNSATVDAFRAYFEPTSTAATASMLMMAFGGNQGETTGLGGIFTDKREKNRENGWYMLDGRKLNGEPTQKGIYIYNGKKVKK